MRAAAFLFAAALLPVVAGFAAPDGVVTGQYLEERSNRVFGCPCEFSAEWVDAGRTAVLAWNIQSGIYQGQSLRGLRLVAVLASDASLSSERAGRRSTIFVHDVASPPQQRAGVAWLMARYGEMLGRVVGERTAHIEFSFDEEAAGVRVEDFVLVRLRRADVLRDADSWAAPLYDPLTKLTSATLAVTLTDEYRGPDLRMTWKREGSPISGFFGRFAM